MRYGFYVPNFDVFGDARLLAELAYEAEVAGWDGFFVWDHLQFTEPAVDPWIAMAAIALRTSRIRLGPLVTPVPRRHIAKLAREVITLDHLSNGRTIFGVGAGFPHLPDYKAFGDEIDLKIRGMKLDEGLDVLVKLWSGEPLSFKGEHYRIDCAAFQQPMQRPRPPIWVAASWPAKRPMLRAARWDGVVPVGGPAGLEANPEDIRKIAEFVTAHRTVDAPFDISRFGQTKDPGDVAIVKECAQAGATWWLEYVYAGATTVDATRSRIRQGPPRI